MTEKVSTQKIIKRNVKNLRGSDALQKRCHKLEQELRKTKRRLNAIIDSVPDIIYRLDPQGRISFISDAVKDYGYNPKDLIGKHIFEFVHPEDRDRSRYHVNERRTGGRKTKAFEIRLTSKKQLYIPFEIKEKEVKMDPVFLLEAEGLYGDLDDSKAEFIGTLGVARDITERKQSEKVLLDSIERYRTLFENANDAIFVMDKDKIVECNPKTIKMFRCQSSQIIGKPPWYFSPKKQQDGQDSKKKVLAKIKCSMTGEPQFFEWLHKRQDGEIFDAEISLNRIEFSGRQHLLALVRDVTQQKQLEKQLRQSQKMEAIGSLAGGIAHDFNNFLTVIRGYSEILLAKLHDKDPLNTSVKQIDKAAQRAESLTRQLLAFSRRQILKPKVLDLNKLIGEMEKMLKRIIGEDIEFLTHLDSDLHNIKADPGQIEQVIMNIVINSRDAMIDGGKLILETKNMHLDDFYRKHRPQIETGPYVLIAITDTGIGMDKITQAHIFEPFFTTKEKGKGTGLGLATVYGIVKQSGGFIWTYSEPEQGTTFNIYFPAVFGRPDQEKSKKTENLILKGEETILVVEDEDEVRSLICETLKLNGYNVLAAGNGSEALQICKQNKKSINIILTDMVMPQMSGRELVDRIVEINNTMKVLFMSGYTDRSIVEKGFLEPGTHFIQKPFTPLALLRKVREVLEEKLV